MGVFIYLYTKIILHYYMIQLPWDKESMQTLTHADTAQLPKDAKKEKD